MGGEIKEEECCITPQRSRREEAEQKRGGVKQEVAHGSVISDLFQSAILFIDRKSHAGPILYFY